jgi:hypothetical protein
LSSQSIFDQIQPEIARKIVENAQLFADKDLHSTFSISFSSFPSENPLKKVIKPLLTLALGIYHHHLLYSFLDCS